MGHSKFDIVTSLGFRLSDFTKLQVWKESSMFRRYTIAVVLGILITFGTAPTRAQISVNPTRPSASDNAYLTARGYTEIEFGLAYDRDAWALPTLLKWTLHPRIELGFITPGLIQSDDSDVAFGDPGLQIKTQWFSRNRGAFATVGRIELTGEKPKATLYAVTSLATDRVGLDATFGAFFFDDGSGAYENGLLYAAAAAPKFKGKIGGYVEVYGETASGNRPIFLDVGISYACSNRFVLDASAAFGLNDDAQEWIFQIGFTSLLFKISR